MVDLGFPRLGWGANPVEGGGWVGVRQANILHNVCQKLHDNESERNWAERGVRPYRPLPDPPMSWKFKQI